MSPQVGDQMIHIRTTHGRGRGAMVDVVVTKVARKYFYVKAADGSSSWWLDKAQFHIDTGYEKVDSGYADRVTTQDELDAEDYRRGVLDRFTASRIHFLTGERDYTTEQLEAAADALGLPREDQQ